MIYKEDKNNSYKRIQNKKAIKNTLGKLVLNSLKTTGLCPFAYPIIT